MSTTGDSVQEVPMHLGIRVRHEREKQGFSREELTQRMPEDMRMHTNTLWSIEVGRTKNPRMDQLQALALALGVSVPYIMGETDETGPGGRRRQRRIQKERTDE